MRSNLLKKILGTVVAATFILSATASFAMINTSAAGTSKYGVGQGVNWPEQVCAPFADMVYYKYDVTNDNYSGAISLDYIMQNTGVKFYNLGFIQTIDKGYNNESLNVQNQVVNGKINWGWGGYAKLSEKSTDQYQLNGIKKSIRVLREKGGDVCISFGGGAGTAFWQTSQDVNILYNTYKEIIEGYGLTRIDLDVEGAAENEAQNIKNAEAIKKVQDDTGVEVSLTLSIDPNGFTSTRLNILKAYLSKGVNIKVVNIMAMAYGTDHIKPGENYGTTVYRAIDRAKAQVQEYYRIYVGKTLSDSEAYRKIGVTTNVGNQTSDYPKFTADFSKLVTDYAISKGLGMTSFWSINKDSKFQEKRKSEEDRKSDLNTEMLGIKTTFEHTNQYKRFGATVVNEAPKFSGTDTISITLGKSFDKLEGVTAIDKEGGNITSSIKVSGEVNTNILGEYKLTYSVSDSKGLTTTVTRVVKIIKPVDIVTLSEVANKYNAVKGDKVYDIKYDLNEDKIIDLYDLVIVAKNL